MSLYGDRFKTLNDAQKQAVETIDGPLLVLAGPGTGKTTLLTIRVAHILKHTDTLPESILCLTFTDSAQKNMQNRLVELIGQDAYKVRIHTFHSFGAWVLQSYPQYFERLINSQQADDMTRYQLLLSIFERLDHHDPLASINDGDYLYLSDAMTRISQLKQAAVTPDQLAAICATDQAWLDNANRILKQDFAAVTIISKSTVPAFEAYLSHLQTIKEESRLGEQCRLELRDALEEAHADNKVSTKPLTAWKNSWLIKKGDGTYELKYGSTLKRLNSLVHIYRTYQATMQKRQLTDYDDQLMLLLEALAAQPDLLAEIQERFIYILADEYQDTNGVQQRILETIADNPIHDSRPNVMVVGDDDQAIYGFQGAYSSNLLDFLKRWRDVQTVVLTENYRSTPQIVDFSRAIITQGENRLEDQYEYINKHLTTPNKSGKGVTLHTAHSGVDAYQSLAREIKRRVDSGVPPDHIAVLAPQHKYLERLVSYLTHYAVGVSYERRQDVLQEQHMRELTLLAEVVVLLMRQQHREANDLLPELLSFTWWGLQPETIWEISLQSYQKRRLWLDVMQDSAIPEVAAIAAWLIKQSQLAQGNSLETALDRLMGYGQRRTTNPAVSFVSPYYSYYFLEQESEESVQYVLSALLSLRRHIRNYVGQQQLGLADFVLYIQLRRQSGLPIVNDHPLASQTTAVNLMTAYKAKGLEFDHVYILDTQHSVWAKRRGRSSLIAIAPHIAAVPTGETVDEQLRVFYVGITRAAKALTLIRAAYDEENSPILPLGWLEDEKTRQLLAETEAGEAKADAITRGLAYDWHEVIAAPIDAHWKQRLADQLERYRLSATHLGTFLDVTAGGPRTFMINHLLRFPQGTSPNIAFGNAMHHIMNFLHNEINNSGSLPPVAQTLANFDTYLADCRLGEIELPKQTTRGHRTVEALYKNGLRLFNETGQISELDLTGKDIMIGSARVSGKIDLFDTQAGLIRDYKTGKPAAGWPKENAKSYEALKLHHYKQQLLFYKLMAGNAPDYSRHGITKAELVFLESADHSELQILTMNYEDTELKRLEQLIQIVWTKVMALDLPDVTKYPPDVTGIRQFEEDLLSGAA